MKVPDTQKTLLTKIVSLVCLICVLKLFDKVPESIGAIFYCLKFTYGIRCQKLAMGTHVSTYIECPVTISGVIQFSVASRKHRTFRCDLKHFKLYLLLFTNSIGISFSVLQYVGKHVYVCCGPIPIKFL